MNLLRSATALVATVTFALALAACGGLRDDPSAGTETRTITIDGVDREYRIYLPAQLAEDPSLVVMMHGGFGSARQAQDAYGWDEQADAGGFVVAYPNGENRVWNAGNCCGASAREGVDDVAFIAGMVDVLQDEFGISPEHTFGTGMSNGAMMAYRMACDTDVFAAIAPVAGTIVTACDNPTPTSVLHIHGLDDSSVRMDGEPGDGVGKVDGMPIAEVTELWLTADGCGEPILTEEDPVRTSTSECADGRTVTLITVAGAGHQWPSSVPREGAADEPTDAIDATALIAEFFAAA